MAVASGRSLGAWARALVVVVAALSLGSCYKPTITDGGFLCSPKGECPDGYKCGDDNLCSLVPFKKPPPPPPDSGTDTHVMMMTDAGGETSMCVAPVALCATGPAAGEACSPACQGGCDCGRCNVVDGKATCVTAGTVKLGDVCTPTADNCGPGLICLLEMCGNGLARCYRHCTTNDQCDGNACTINIEDAKGAATPYYTCDVPQRTCNPVAVVGDSGCPDPALNCYLTSLNQTLCDCPSRPANQGGINAECTLYSQCAAGFICISGVDGQTTPHCHFVCEVGKPSCPTAEPHCVPTVTGAKYGFCSMM